MVTDNLANNPLGHSLFRRCVQCPPEQPSCPSCASDETCQLISPPCDSCPYTVCTKIGSLPGQLAEKPSTPIGPIVGGVVGGVVAVSLALYLVWRFWIRPRRQAQQSWEAPEKRDQSTLARGDRQSTRSAHSIASTVLTRASNVIQIAYIPGVTVRSPPESPGLLAPPMPSFPGGSVNSSTLSTPAIEQHFFMPGDLRDSTWSDASSFDQRISIAPSLARSTFYGDNAIVPPIPAQQAFRAQPNMVSLKSSGLNTPSGLASAARTPPVPQVPKLGGSNSSIVARHVVARPVEVRKAGSGPRVPTLGSLAKQATTTKMDDSSSDSEKSVPVFIDEQGVVSNSSEGALDSPVSPLVNPKPSFATFDSGRSSSVSAILPSEGPMGSGNATTHRHSKSDGLNAMIEAAINRARDPHVSVRPGLAKHDSGPFSDENEVKENLL